MDCIKDDLESVSGDDSLTIETLRLWLKILGQDIPHERAAAKRWQAVSNVGRDTCRSRWERNHVRIYAAMGR